MSIKLKKVRRTKLSNHAESEWYLVQNSRGYIGLKDIARDIATRSSLTAGDVRNTLDNLVDMLVQHLKAGYTVRLEGFGACRLSVSSEGKPTAEELNARHVKGAKIIFTPSAELKQGLSDLRYSVG